MICAECNCCKRGFFKRQPNEYVCIGSLRPFVIHDINAERNDCPFALSVARPKQATTANTTNVTPNTDATPRQVKLKSIYRHKIDLVTFKDVNAFVKAVEGLPGEITLCDGSGFRVNAKSLLGAMASVEWDSLYCESEEDIYFAIQGFCV